MIRAARRRLACWVLPALAAAPPVAAEPLRISAAVSLGPALRDAMQQQEVEAELSTGGSAVLTQQILRGAPVDLLISASPLELDRLVHAGLTLAGTRRSLASNRLVLALPCGILPIAELHELGAARFGRVAVGNPRTAPVGRYAQAALRDAGIWSTLEPRLVFGEHARQTLNYVVRGDVDAAVVYSTDVALAGDSVCTVIELDASGHEPILYEGIVLRESPRGAAAQALLDWLASDGRPALLRHGFLPPP